MDNNLSKLKAHIDNLNNDFKIEFFYKSLFDVLNTLSKENSITIYSLIENLVNLLPKDNIDLVLSDFFKSIATLMLKENIDIFKILEKFFKLLNQQKQNQLLDSMQDILNTINNSLTQIAKSNVEFPVPPVSMKVNNNVIQTLKNTIPPPPPPPANLAQNKTITTPMHHPNINKNLPNVVNSPPPPPPGSITRTTNLSEHLKLTNKTMEFNFNSQNKDIECIYPDEIIKHLIPSVSDNGRKALNSFATPIEIYQFLKKVDGTKTLENLFQEIYKGNDIISYIYKIHNMNLIKVINLNKSLNFPENKRLKIKIGEVLVFMKLIEKENLEKIVKLHEIAKKTQRFEKRNLTKTLAELRLNNLKNEEQILFGEFLINSEIIKVDKLEEALKFQIKYNEIMENIK